MTEPAPYFDDDDREPGRGGGRKAVVKTAATVAAVAVLGFGASKALSKSNPTSASANSSAPSGQMPGGPGGGRMMGTPVTGATLTKLKAVVSAKYPGTIERAFKRQDGSYEVHVIKSDNSEVHVLVSKDFKITGTEQGGPPAGAGSAPPPGQSAPSTGTQS
jgi:hypothetical protein